MSYEKKTVTDDSDCVDDEEDTHLVHKPKTSGKLTLYHFTPKIIIKIISDVFDIRSFFPGELLHEFWQTSSLQGLPRVFTETIRFWKFFWFALFLLLLAGCIYQVQCIQLMLCFLKIQSISIICKFMCTNSMLSIDVEHI